MVKSEETIKRKKKPMTGVNEAGSSRCVQERLCEGEKKQIAC